MKKEKAIKRLLAILLPIALVICSIQVGRIDRVEAADETGTVTINASTINAAIKADTRSGDGWSLGKYESFDGVDGISLTLTANETIFNMDENLTVGVFIAEGSLTIKGAKKLSATVLDVYGNATLNGANLELRGRYSWNFVCNGDISIIASTVTSKCTFGKNGTMQEVSVSRIHAEQNIYAMGTIELSGGSYIKTPSNGKVTQITSDFNGEAPTYSAITDSEGKAPENIEIAVKEAAPEKAADETPAQENTSDSGKKSYKNEWVNGQWYDANGKTDYKYKGSWKKNSTGWWYEDENGWFPTNMWQKIDGDWYFFHESGYMAENEYAGKWALYSEGYWWVGSDGRWDGSEPGVWRLVGTKWWFKDSTGWYAKGKWYKIGGKWYEFDNDGWWVEPE